jgi:hypothetical protein
MTCLTKLVTHRTKDFVELGKCLDLVSQSANPK